MENKIIYHYTSPEGLKSILENRSLRFTSYRFLNDKKEGLCKENDVSKKLEELKGKDSNSKGKDFFELLKKQIIDTNIDDYLLDKSLNGEYCEIKNDYYVLSLSKETDSLSMWNYYIKNKKYEGYNIGFDLENLQKIFSNFAMKYKGVRFEYKDINYINKEEENSEFEKIVLYFRDQYIKTFTEKMKIVFECRDKILMNYIFSKNDCFRHENEYRFILMKNKISEIKEQFYIKNGIITPYVDIPLDNEDILKTIKSITISPLLEEEIAKKGLENFLINKEYELYDKQKQTGIRIEKSKCPIRY